MKKKECLICPLWDISTGHCDADDIKSSKMFVVAANRDWLKKVRKGNTRLTAQLDIARSLSKSIILIMDKKLTVEEKAELEGVLVNHSVAKVIESDLGNDAYTVHEEVKKILENEFKDEITISNE